MIDLERSWNLDSIDHELPPKVPTIHPLVKKCQFMHSAPYSAFSTAFESVYRRAATKESDAATSFTAFTTFGATRLGL